MDLHAILDSKQRKWEEIRDFLGATLHLRERGGRSARIGIVSSKVDVDVGATRFT